MGATKGEDGIKTAQKMTRISVLIAVYNTEAYLRECLDSLRTQTLQEWEAICVDDASTDHSLQVLREYASLDARIRVVSLNENGGQAHARNVALAMAQGDIVAFLDSDDWFSPDALALAVASFDANPSTGCVLFDVLKHYSSHTEHYAMPKFDAMTGREAFEKSLTWAIHGVYAVRASIHRRYPYDETLRAYGDDNVTRLHYLASQEVRLCRGVYHYRQHAASVTHQVSMRRFDYLPANRLMKEQLQALGVGTDVLSLYEDVRWLNVVDVYMFYFKHRHEFAPADRVEGRRVIKEAWQSIDLRLLGPRSSRRKFGYMPLRCSWRLFVAQEEVYFCLRRLMGRL